MNHKVPSPGMCARGAHAERYMAPMVSVLWQVAAITSRNTVAVMLAVMSTTACAREPLQPVNQAPTMQVMADLERALILPKGAYPLSKYTRHYAAVNRGGRTMVRGVLVGGPSKVVIETVKSDLPVIMDGGCDVVNVLYDTKMHKIVNVFCNGYA